MQLPLRILNTGFVFSIRKMIFQKRIKHAVVFHPSALGGTEGKVHLREDFSKE
ncbi:MAG: hypothetical protein KIS77_09365 [Saprospiraceae bacterium]|nr:hypothetical protein [Saprospiraceae bacterium]